jgi:hypothetical protein
MPQSISDADLNQLIATDPQIQQIIAGVWGSTPANQRPRQHAEEPRRRERSGE